MLDLLDQVINQELRKKVTESTIVTKQLISNLELNSSNDLLQYLDKEIILRFCNENLEFWITKPIACDRILITHKPNIKLESEQIFVENFS